MVSRTSTFQFDLEKITLRELTRLRKSKRAPAHTFNNLPFFKVVNKSVHVSDDDVSAMVEACQTQLDMHVSVAWQRVPWSVTAESSLQSSHTIEIVDDIPADEKTLGYHTETNKGCVTGKVYVSTVKRLNGNVLSGSKVTVSTVLSHEISEMFIDPYVNDWTDSRKGLFVAHEICDPVEGVCYDITCENGVNVSVSNFVLPSWFDPRSTAERYDHLCLLTAPFTLTRSGYVLTLDPRTGAKRCVFGVNQSSIS